LSPSRIKKLLCFPHRLYRLASLLLSEYWELFLQGFSGRGVKLVTYFQPMPGLRIIELYLDFITIHHGLMLNYSNKGTTLL
jgi:hypothetical protein